MIIRKKITTNITIKKNELIEIVKKHIKETQNISVDSVDFNLNGELEILGVTCAKVEDEPVKTGE